MNNSLKASLSWLTATFFNSPFRCSVSELGSPLFNIGVRACIWSELSVWCSDATVLSFSTHMAVSAVIEAVLVEVNESVYILMIRGQYDFGSQNNTMPLFEIYNI